MKDIKHHDSMKPHRAPHEKLFLTGIVVLIVGLLGAILVYWSAVHSAVPGLDIDNGGDKQYDYQVERMGGQVQLMMVQFNHWLGSLFHGTTLAYTLAVISVAVALVCFWLADLIKE
jgi:hypothetical protein